MLTIVVPASEKFDENTNQFIRTSETTLKLEHSLLSISKWESKWCKPFLGNSNKKTNTEVLDYVRCMTLNKVPNEVYTALTQKNLEQISEYINWPMTATTINDSTPGGRQIVTSELIYYWMISCQIPFECEKWHLNRLLTLIRVCNAKNNPKKMSRQEIFNQNRQLNAARRRALHTRG